MYKDKWNQQKIHFFLEKLGFSRRESFVIDHLLAAKSDKEVGDNLNISESTVGTHLNNIFKKAGVHSRSEFILWLYKKGLNDQQSPE